MGFYILYTILAGISYFAKFCTCEKPVIFSDNSYKYFYSPREKFDEKNVYINPRLIRKANLVLGEFPSHVEKRIREGICLNIVIFGGSNACGSSMNSTNPESPGYFETGFQNIYPEGSFSMRLFNLLNTSWPCVVEPRHINGIKPFPKRNIRFHGSSNTHQVSNLCYPAGGSDVTLSTLSHLRSNSTHEYDVKSISAILSADIIIIESSLNDYKLIKRKGVQFYGEMLYRYFNTLPNKPGMLYLEMISGGNLAINDESRHADSTLHHYKVAKYFNIPLISVLDSIGPGHSAKSVEFFNQEYRADDCCHASKTGHQLVAALLFKYLLDYFEGLTYPVHKYIDREDNKIDYAKKPFKFCTKEEFEEYVQDVPFTIKLNEKSNSTLYSLFNISG